MELKNNFNEKLVLNYHLYKSILLTLPFSQIEHYGVLLSLFSQSCLKGIEEKKSPEEIVESFFRENQSSGITSVEEKANILFKFIQFIERQVTIFDSLEDAYFNDLNTVNGEGTLYYFLNLVNSSWKYGELAKKIQEYKIRIVLTAHPTQFYSVHVLGMLSRLTRAMKKKDNVEVRRLFKQMGKTHFYSRSKITPIEEVKSIMVFLRRVFYHHLPKIEEKIEKEILSHLGEDYLSSQLSNFIKIGFWPGGDRDGNPFVTHETTLQTAHLLKKSIITCYLHDLRRLQDIFTFRGVYKEVKRIRRKLTETLSSHHDEGRGYSGFKEFTKDLIDLRNRLITEHESLFLDDLDFFIRKTRCFGFHFVSIDIRQNSRIYTQVIGELALTCLGFDYVNASVRAKTDFLLFLNNKTRESGSGSSAHEKNNTRSRLDEWIEHSKLSEQTLETLKTLRASLKIQKENGEEGLHRYIISNAQSEISVLEVAYLFSLAGRNLGQINIDIIPLFETMDDLAKAGNIMERLYSIPAYREQVNYRDSRQVVMLGFSDGTKDGGYVAANWAIMQAKEAITAVSRKYRVKVIFFDGRGGPPGRGGGESNKFYSSLGKKVENQEIQLTVQGQTISSKYGQGESFTYNVEQLLVAGLEGHLFDNEQNDLNLEQRKILYRMADLSYKAYVKLKNHPRFMEYLGEATPLRFYGDTNIGSRPTKRVTGGFLGLSDLRAIPFVSSWSQMKQNIPAYYGMGIALKTMYREGEGEKIVSLYRKSAFFRTLINNSIQALAKTNLDYTRHISKDSRLGGIWKLIAKETQLSYNMIMKITGKKILFPENDINRYSIPFRESIVTPLVIIQQYALSKLLLDSRGTDKKKKILTKTQRNIYEKMVIRSMPGLINAGRNSA